ncbi:hypothetical protein AB4559_08335 [Vibrio sp. 10N.222.51.C8]|uniref:hypothetical protein n=1 Tax=unclassified Vibrio TaxID=2614977 RepID=UPI000C81D6F4|nr:MULTISPECIES: hypothetical protein [unclassified Vibrio]PMK24883.1 hypothetical protein BCU05_07640 [Vibrio sp. 10N.261.54.C3]PMN97102.1 hypothetical protein BCT20_18250 [Vibrio sp. 10N.222.55.C12]PMO05842.1 hypothetical protein BCT21_05325 [Vibrio sp. 10N.222.55.F9]PMO16248.1 hypothetical protein BCT17_07825 [Vibrio sp. 10N.222.54.F10]PMO16746.1 hypothetical protein BCT16_16105 [Vibrio sp. 10N.222.54.B6]
MIWDTLERVNKLRKEAMEDPEFLDSAKMHEEWLLSETHNQLNKGAKEKKPKKLSDIYENTDFPINPTGTKH